MINNQTIQAVNSAIQVLHTMQHVELSNVDFLCTFANNLLSAQGVSIEIDEMATILQSLVNSKYITNRNGVISANVHIKEQVPRFQGKKGQEQIIKILDGKVLTLYFYPLRKKLQEDYLIQYNVDGKGSSKLPDGTVVTEGLGSLARKIFADNSDRLPYQVATQNEWIVDKDHHDDAPAARSKSNFKSYMEQLFIQQNAVV